MHSPGMGTWDKRCMHGWGLLQGEVLDAPIAFSVCARGRCLECLWEMMQSEHVVGCRETGIWSISGCWGMHGASLWNGDGYANGMNALCLPMPGERGERYVAIGARIRGREHSLGWHLNHTCKRVREDLNSLCVVFAIILYTCG